MHGKKIPNEATVRRAWQDARYWEGGRWVEGECKHFGMACLSVIEGS